MGIASLEAMGMATGLDRHEAAALYVGHDAAISSWRRLWIL
jgi:hypothetical protein